MELEKRVATTANAGGFARLLLLLAFSIVGIAAGWHLLYGIGLLAALAVVGEIAVILTLAFVCAWRWSR